MEAPVEEAEQRDWSALPAGVLQHISGLASTWQTPGSCLAARVCSAWRSAAAGCRGIRLLYFSGRMDADWSFAAWLRRSSPQLEALTLISLSGKQILVALAEAAAAAQAAGSPLRLQTLRVLQTYVQARTAGQLLERLPYLRCLQLRLLGTGGDVHLLDMDRSAALLEHLAPLQRATQLEQLYLGGWFEEQQGIAELLPLSLRRLSWEPEDYAFAGGRYDLSHLKQLAFLQLRDPGWETFSSSHLPPGLQQLEVLRFNMHSVDMEEAQPQVVTAWDIPYLVGEEAQRVLSHLPNLRAVGLEATYLGDPATQAALQQHPKVSALTVPCLGQPAIDLPAAVSTAASMHGLRRLHLEFDILSTTPAEDALTQLTQLTQLQVCVTWLGDSVNHQQQQQQHSHWAAVVGRMTALQWLSVPDVLLIPGQAWLAGLQQLRVLVLHWVWEPTRSTASWLEGCSREVLPPQLQVLGVHGMTAEQAESWQLRRRLRQALGSSGCEVVVGADLDEVADPTQQLAGLPAALQKALA